MASSPAPPTPDPCCTATRHGTVYAYRKFKCRCEVARRAAIKDQQLWMLAVSRIGGPLRIDRTGTVRRLTALVAAGWTFEELARRIGGAESSLQQMCLPRHGPTISRATVVAVRGLYEELEHEDGPSAEGRRRARRKGWPPPECWFEVDMDDPAARPVEMEYFTGVDEVAVARLRGGHLRLESARDQDICMIFAQLRREGMSPHQAAEQVGVADLVAQRYWKRMDRHG